jgi:hypothetical protein
MTQAAARRRSILINSVGLSGLGLLAAGLWLVHPPSCLIIVGAVLFLLALWAIVR